MNVAEAKSLQLVDWQEGFFGASLEGWADLRSMPPHIRLNSHPVIKQTQCSVAFDHFAVGGVNIAGHHFDQRLLMVSNLPHTFIVSYVTEQLAAADPLLDAIKKGVDCAVNDTAPNVPDSSDRLSYLLQTFEIGNRLIFAVRRHEKAYGYIWFSRLQPFLEEEADFLRVVAACLHREVTAPLMQRFATTEVRLTKGELACLRSASHGLTTAQIASATGFRPDTVNGYVQSAASKLGCTNRAHAIAEAIRRELIL